MRRSRLDPASVVAELTDLESRNDLPALIALLRTAIAVNRRIFVEPVVKSWCARRWRYLFVREAVEDPVALDAATAWFDKRPVRQRIVERFLFHDVVSTLHDEQPAPEMPDIRNMTLLVCPGLLNGLLPQREFLADLPRVEHRFSGLRVVRSESHPARSCAANVADIMRALKEGEGSDAKARLIPLRDALPPEGVFAVAYSKGAPDLLTTLVAHPEVKDRFRCIFTWAGAIGGSEVANDIADKFERFGILQRAGDLSIILKRFARRAFGATEAEARRIDEFDSVAAVRDLTTSVRQAFLQENAARIDSLDIPFFTIRGVTQPNEIPWSQRYGFQQIAKVDPENDMQVGGYASKLAIPMATELAVLHGHHWDLAYPSFKQRRWLNKTYHPFPKTAAMTAMVQLAAELGLLD